MTERLLLQPWHPGQKSKIPFFPLLSKKPTIKDVFQEVYPGGLRRSKKHQLKHLNIALPNQQHPFFWTSTTPQNPISPLM